MYRARRRVTCHCVTDDHDCYDDIGAELISFLQSIRVRTFKIGPMVRHSCPLTKSPRSMPRAMLFFRTSQIHRRKLYVVQSDSKCLVSLILILIPVQPFLDVMRATTRPIVELRH